MNRADFKRSFLTLTALAIVGLAVPLSAQPKYVVSDLGTLGGSFSVAEGINNAGQVVGQSQTTGNASQRGFRTAPNAPINPATDDIGSLGGTDSDARGINNSGQVVGLAYLTGDTVFHAFRTAANASINPATDDLGTLTGTPNSIANGVNDSGQTVGRAQGTSGLPHHAFRTAPNASINPATDALGTLGGTLSDATGINNASKVSGFSTIAGDLISHAFRTAANAPINPATDDLGTLGGTYSESTGINNSDQVIGFAQLTGSDATFPFHAFRAAASSPINPATDDLGTLGGAQSLAYGINARGDVVGTSSRSVSPAHAFIFTGGVLYDLNSQLYASSGWELIYAYGINDAGQIVGQGIHNGVTEQAFRLDPLITVGIIVNSGTPRPASFNIDSEGAIPVAILGSATFDATTIDPASVMFGPKGAKNSRTPVLQDVNNDGKLDLVLYFAPDDSGVGCADNEVVLIGTTRSKQLLFTGSETVKTTHTFPCPR
jgi:probable HAF family extracellular repeat protein